MTEEYTRLDKAEAIILYMAVVVEDMLNDRLSQDTVEEQLHQTFPGMVMFYTNLFPLNEKFKKLKDEGYSPSGVIGEVFPELFTQFSDGSVSPAIRKVMAEEIEKLIKEVEEN